jgi:1,4-alpha-glucan branching enzyme
MSDAPRRHPYSPPPSRRAGPDAPAELPFAALDALAHARHGDPFAVLGPHRLAPGLWEVRAVLPEARAAQVVGPDGGLIATMERRHPAGIFIARLSTRERPVYRLAIQLDGGAVDLRHDPYSFGPVLPADQLGLLTDIGNDAVERLLGARPVTHGGVEGFVFALWAPNARAVSVVGDFNAWDGRRHPMRMRYEAGVWELFIPGLAAGQRYKFEVRGADGVLQPAKADPVAFQAERPPATASVLHGPPAFPWNDAGWMARRVEGDPRHKPMAIYEAHLGSWARMDEEGGRYLTYRELADRLIPYVQGLGFTHIELLPITEHPFDGSWGYQPVSLFAPTSRFGPPEDFAHFVETAHNAGLGLMLDWVPGHFPTDAHGFGRLDGTHLYEHADPRQGFHQDWGTYIYNFGREEVAAFLVDNARFWASRYHIDGLRVDAVASMLYLDYSRRPGEWIPNRYGGNENLEAIAFIKKMNEAVYGHNPGVITVAEESTAWPGVSHPTYAGGLGFGFKWNMGWMHDTLEYMKHDPMYRSWHHDQMTFGLVYAWSENYILPLSHDEVVHGKGSLLGRMPGDEWQRFANLRAYFGFMWGHPGKKLVFMGGELGQYREWNHDTGLDWHLLQYPLHAGVQRLTRDLNRAYRAIPALYERDSEPAGFAWLVGNDRENSVFAWARHGQDGSLAVVASNFTPVPRIGYRIGVPGPGFYREAVNTDALDYGGSGVGNLGGVAAEERESHGRPWSIVLTLPPLATLILERVAG